MSTKKTFKPLFTPASDWWNNAALNWSDDSLEYYILGYKEAADILVLKVDELGQSQDILVFPVCFLYRHYLELRLKEIIREGSFLLDKGYIFPKHHKLSRLWPDTKRIVSEIWPDDKSSSKYAVRINLRLDAVEHAIAEYSKLDDGSYAFRYPIDTKDNDVLVGVKSINLRHLAEFMNDVAETLDNISDAIAICHDHQQEFYSTY